MSSITETIRSRRLANLSAQHKVSGLIGLASGSILYHTSSITTGYNLQLRQKLSYLKHYDDIYRTEVEQRLRVDSNYRGSRDKGVDQAWAYERTELEFGGRGSVKWTKNEREEILKRGRLRGAEAHHQKNVANHPEEQANPNNFRFFRTKEEHLQVGHNGDFRNESDAPFIDRTKRITRANTRRVLIAEATAVGLTAIIAFATTASMSFIIEMAKGDSSPEDFKRAFSESMKIGGISTITATVCYGLSRIIITPATTSLSNALARAGIHIGEIGRGLVGMGIMAVVTIAITSFFTYVCMRRSGVSIGQSLKRVAINASIGAAFAIAGGVLWAVLKKADKSNKEIFLIEAAFAVIVTIGTLFIELVHVHINKETADRIESYIMQRYYPQISLA